MKTRMSFVGLVVVSLFMFIDCTPRYSIAQLSAEEVLGQASSLDDWRQRLKTDEQRLTDYEAALDKRKQDIETYLASEQGRNAKNREVLEQELESLADKRSHLNQQWQVYQQNAAAIKQREQEIDSRERLFAASQNQAVQNTLKDMQQRQALSDRPQTMTGVTQEAIVRAEPRMIGTLPNGDIGLTGGDVQVFVIEQADPTPQPTAIPKQDARTRFGIEGIDDIEIKAKLPETLDENNLTAVQDSLKTGEVIAIQRFQLEEQKLENEKEVSQLQEYSRIIWWSLFFAPFLLYFGVKSLIAYKKVDFDLYEKRVKLETGILTKEN